MRAKLLILCLITSAALACNKDSYTTQPQLTFKGVDHPIIAPNSTIEFQLNYTDKEGDIQSHIWVQKLTRNCPASNFTETDSIPPNVPTQKNAKGEIDLDYAYGTIPGYESIQEPQCQGQNDTCVFRFALTDLAGHTSDTVTSSVVILVHR
jgi:hypothetical protein